MSVGWVIAIAVGGTVLMGAAFAWLMIRLGKSAGPGDEDVLARLRAELPRRGWTYAERDDSVVQVYAAQPEFRRRDPWQPLVPPPKPLGARDVITGTHRGRPFLAAEFDVRQNGQRIKVGAVWVRTPSMRPPVTVRQVVELQSRVRSAIGQGDLRLGTPGFDERFEITTDDERFARAVLVPPVVNFLAAAPEPVRGFAIYGDQLDVHDGFVDHRDPARLVPALDRRCDLLDLIPASVWA